MKARQLIGWIIWTIVVGAVLFLAVREVMSQTLPPLPKRPVLKKKAAVTNTTQGAGALQLITPKVVLPPTNKVILTWNWTGDPINPASNIVFVVRSLTTNQYAPPSTNWPVIAVVTNHFYTQNVDQTIKFRMFVVSASNRFSGMESPFATR